MSITTTPATDRSSGLSMTGASVDASSAMIGATVAVVAEAEVAGTDATAIRSGATSLMRTAGRTSLAWATRGSSLVRTALRATQLCLFCLHRQEGTKITTRTRGLGASRSRGPSPASWAAHKPQLPTVSSSSLRARSMRRSPSLRQLAPSSGPSAPSPSTPQTGSSARPPLARFPCSAPRHQQRNCHQDSH